MTAARVRSRGSGRAAVVALLALTLVAAPGSAWALWSARAELMVPASTGVVAAPTDVRCTDRYGGLLNLTFQGIDVAWRAPAGAAPAGYHLLVSDGATFETISVPGTSTDYFIDNNSSLLGSLLGGLAGSGVTVTVRALHGSGWTSAGVSCA